MQQGIIIQLCKALVKTQLEYWIKFWVAFKKSNKNIRHLENVAYWKQLK